MFTKIWNWLVKSSANPEKTAMTIRGLIGFLAILGFVDATQLDELNSAIVAIIIGIVTIGTAIMTVFGLVRKIILTFTLKE